MNDQTNEQLSQIDVINDDTPPTSQADHLRQVLKGKGASQDDSASVLGEVDDLLDLMGDDVEVDATSATSSNISSMMDSSQPVSAKDTNNANAAIDAVALALEAAKTAQEAAENSQKSSEMAIKNAHELKAEVIELADSNYAWRQLVKTATKEIKGARTTVSILAIISIIFSMAAAGIMGYYLYALNQKYEQLKGEVLDIIQIETALFQKKFSTKVDELSSLVEYLSSKVDKISQQTHAAPDTATEVDPVTSHSDGSSTLESAKNQEESHKESQKPKPEANLLNEVSNKTPHLAVKDYSEEFKAIEQVIQNILHKQEALTHLVNQAIQENKKGHSAVPSAAHSNRPILAKLSPEDEKKLAAIRWLIKKQSQQIKQIERVLKQKSGQNKQAYNLTAVQNSLKTIQRQVKALQTQQDALRKEVQILQQETRKLTSKRPYYYRAPGIDP